MKILVDDLWFCVDCMIYAVNGDEPDPDDNPTWESDGVDGFGPHLVPDFDSETCTGMQEFSRQQCDACGTRLGGSRHRFAVLGEAKDKAEI